MKASDLRKRDGSYTPLARKIDKEVGKFLHGLFRKYGKKMHPDSLFVLLSHSVFCESTWQVITQICEKSKKRSKKQKRIQKRKEHIISKVLKTKAGKARLAKAMLKGITPKKHTSRQPKGKKHGRG